MKRVRKIGCLILSVCMLLSIAALGEAIPQLEKVTDYLYEVTFDTYDYLAGAAYLQQFKPSLGGCSSVQYGQLRGRNYDWYYDESIECIIHVPQAEGRHASLGVAVALEITNAEVQTGTYDADELAVVPFITVDGINDAGLCVNINVVNYGEKGLYTMKTETEADDVCCAMVTRLLLDNAATVEEALEILGRIDLFGWGTEDEVHYMITGAKSADDPAKSTVVVEFIPDQDGHYQLSVIGDKEHPFVDDKPIMTNFHLTGFDGTAESLTAHPLGWERYLILAENYELGSTEQGMADLMKMVYSTRQYDLSLEPFWYSEYACGECTMERIGESCLNGDLSAAGKFRPIIEKGMNDFLRGERDGTFWQTVHSVVYNVAEKNMVVRVQEGDEEYRFRLAD